MELMETYIVVIGVIGEDILLEEGLTHYDLSGYVAEQWTLDGKLSRSTGLALTVFNDRDIAHPLADDKLAEFWYRNGKLHGNFDGEWPAYKVRDPEYGYLETRYYKNGLLNHTNGAAIIDHLEFRYFIGGVELTTEEFERRQKDPPPASPSPRIG